VGAGSNAGPHFFVRYAASLIPAKGPRHLIGSATVLQVIES